MLSYQSEWQNGQANFGNAKILRAPVMPTPPLGVSWTIYVSVDSPNLGFPYFNFLGGRQLKKYPEDY